MCRVAGEKSRGGKSNGRGRTIKENVVAPASEQGGAVQKAGKDVKNHKSSLE